MAARTKATNLQAMATNELEVAIQNAKDELQSVIENEGEVRAEYAWVEAGSYYTRDLYQGIANHKAKLEKQVNALTSEAISRGLKMYQGRLWPTDLVDRWEAKDREEWENNIPF